MDTFTIAVLPGDGIGPDVIREAVRVLHAIEQRLTGVAFKLQYLDAGAEEYLRNGDPLPERTLEACRLADAILLGAMGLPHVRRSEGTEMAPQIDLREQLDLYAGIRPIYLYNRDHSPLRGYDTGAIDLIIVRESTEGLFVSRKNKHSANASEVSDTLRITRTGAERVTRSAFQLAKSRRRRVTLVDKANVLPSMAFFRSVFDGVAQDYPDVEAGHVYVDAAALYLVKSPQQFDVMVMENLFGDILSDLAAGIVGGMGMAPSADIGDKHAVFQPSHGSAPDIAGKGLANPVATILSVAMMLDWLPGDETTRGAGLIRSGVAKALADPANATPDIGGKLSTSAMTDTILENL